jgi:hypothetical protein
MSAQEMEEASRVAFFDAPLEKFVGTTAPVVETVSRKRVISPAELAQEKQGRTTPDFWEFIETMTDEMWAGDFMLYIIREDPKPSNYGGANTLEKCPGFMVMPNGARLRLDSREDIELAIKEKWGGKAFRLILKKGRERLTEGKCMNDAAPKYPDTNGQQFTHPLPNAGGQSDANAIASKAIDTVANQPQEVMNIAINALRASAEMIARSATLPAAAPTPAPSIDSELDRAFKAAMIKKLMDSPPDPVKSFLEIRQALGDGGGGAAAANPLNDLLVPILKAAVDRIVNPLPAVTGRTTLLDLGREFIPVLGTTVRETMHEYRLSVEAQARMAELGRTMPQPPAVPQPVQVVTRVIDSATPSVAAPNPTPAPAAPAAPPMTFQQIEAHIAKIESNVEFTVDEAVDKVLEFLYDTDPRIVPALLNPPSMDARLKPGKDGLLMLFTAEPALQPCLNNLPRLSEFLEKFIVAATEAEKIEANLRAAAPGAAVPAAQPESTV